MTVLGGRSQLHVGLELEPLTANEHHLLACAHVDLAGIVYGYREPQPQEEQAHNGRRFPGTAAGRQPSPG